MTENDNQSNGQIQPALAATELADASSEASRAESVIEEPDTAIDALTRAAVGASKGKAPVGWHAPQSLLVLGIVLFVIFGAGISVFIFLHRIDTKNAQIRLRVLEERQQTFLEQEVVRQRYHVRPAGEEVKPLSASEQADLLNLRQRFGVHSPPQPATTTAPATTQVDGGG